MTRVTIVGAGNMGRGIGTRAVAGDHQVEIVDRDPAEAQQLANDLGDSATALDPGAPFGSEVVVFAVYYPGIKDAVQQYADQLAGKVVVDIANPVDTQTWDKLVLAMNRLRHAHLQLAPALEPYFTTGHDDDEQGPAASYLLAGRGGRRLGRWGQFLVDTPTIVATVDAALAAAIVVLVVRAAEAATTVAVVAGAAAFLVVWAALFSQQRRVLDALRRTTPRFPTPPPES